MKGAYQAPNAGICAKNMDHVQQQLPPDAFSHVAGFLEPPYAESVRRQNQQQFGDGKQPWKISRKHTDALSKVSGKSNDYKHWKERIKDHVADSWHQWRELLDAAEKTSTVILSTDLAKMQFGDATGWDLSVDLWYFLSTCLGYSLFERRNRMVGSEKFNGL